MTQATVVANRALESIGPKRPVGYLSSGLPVAAVHDAGNIYVYLSNAARSVWTLIATVPVAGFVAGDTVNYSIQVDSGDNIHVAYHRTTSGVGIRYRRITANTWALGAEEVAVAGETNFTPGSMDLDVLDSAVVVIGFMGFKSDTSTPTARLIVRHTGAAWVLTTTAGSFLDFSNPAVVNYDSTAQFSIARDAAGAVGGTQKIVFTYQTGGENPVTYFYSTTITLATGAVSALTLITSHAHTFSTFTRYTLFASAADQWTVLGTATSVFSVVLVAMRISSTAVTVPLSSLQVSTTPLIQRNQTGAQHLGGDRGFVGVAQYDGAVSQYVIKAAIATFAAGAVSWGAVFNYGTLAVGATPRLWGGAGRNFGVNRVDLLSSNEGFDPDGTRVDFHKSHSPGVSNPESHTPANGATVTTDVPALSLTYGQTQIALQQGRHKGQWRIASDAGFTSNLRTIIEPDTDFQSGSRPLTFNEVVSNALQLDQRVWYIQGAVVDEFGYVSGYSAATSFTVSHPPVPANFNPTGNATVDWGAAGSITFDWDFTDPSPVDSQTAYQIVVEKVSDGAVVVDSGKVLSTESQGALTIPAANKDIALRWKVRLWDSDNVVGAYSAVQLFKTSDKPTVTVTVPAEGAAANNPSPSVTWTFAASAGRTQSQYRVTYYKNNAIVHDSGWKTGGVTTYQPSGSIYLNGEAGSVTVEVIDSVGLRNSDSNAFTVAFTVPTAPTTLVDVTFYGTNGYNEIEWTRNFISATMSTAEGLAVGAGLGGQWDVFGNGGGNIVSGTVKSGTRAFRLQRTSTGGEELAFRSPVALRPIVEPGKTYTLAAWMTFNVATRSARAQIIWLDGAGNAISTTTGASVAVPVANTFQLVSATGTAPANAARAILHLAGLAMTNAEQVFVDDVVFGRGSSAANLINSDAEFLEWRIYRRVVGTTAWTLLGVNTDPYGAAPEFFDYMASSTTSYEYVVVQAVTRFGVVIESVYNPAASVTPLSEDYWLLHPTDATKNVRLQQVGSDGFTDEYEEETHLLIGRGRKKDIGTHWGKTGTLRAEIWDVSGSTARQQRLAIEALKAERTEMYLRTPFGDLWLVNTGNLQFERMAGVGMREFGSLTIPYEEVLS